MLTEYLEPQRMLLNLKAPNYQDALEKMLTLSERENHTQIINSIMDRETLMTTALGKGIALPRVILQDDINTEIIIAISAEGINLDSFDHLPVRIIFLHLFSEKDNYPSLLAQSLRLLNDDNLRLELLKTKTAEKVVDSIKIWEQR